VSDLLVLLDGHDVGLVRYRRGRLSFAYAETWRSGAGAYPLSLSMPLAAAEHPHGAIEPFLWGLLPDNEVVLEAGRSASTSRHAMTMCVWQTWHRPEARLRPPKRPRSRWMQWKRGRAIQVRSSRSSARPQKRPEPESRHEPCWSSRRRHRSIVFTKKMPARLFVCIPRANIRMKAVRGRI
jgi:HipA-like protein